MLRKNQDQGTRKQLWQKQMSTSRKQRKREAETKIDIAPRHNKQRQQKFKSKAVKAFTPIYTTMTTRSWCAFCEKKPRNTRHVTWTSATGNGMSLSIWYWSTKKDGIFQKRATGTTKCPQTKRENDITIQT